MVRRTLFLLCAVLAVPLSVRGQLTVQLFMERDTLLLYESIPVVATVHNFSGRTVELDSGENAPWLSFLVTDEAAARIPEVQKLPLMEAVQIPPGRTVSRTFNLLPYYDLRQRGTYIVRAVVNSGGRRALSPPVKFTILRGRELWKQTVGLPVAAGETNEEYRTYSLVRLRLGHSDLLYVGVQNEARNLVYGMIALGECLALGEPSAKVDSTGHLHVLYRSGPRSHGYAEIDPQAKTLQRVVYSDLLSVPQLMTGDDGSVAVRGGEQVYPRVEHVMTEAEVNPPPPPPEKPRKKKWWWPFGPAKSGLTSATATNAPATSVGQSR
jgi:hypothetical protein